MMHYKSEKTKKLVYYKKRIQYNKIKRNDKKIISFKFCIYSMYHNDGIHF